MQARFRIAPGLAAYDGPVQTRDVVVHDAACAVLPCEDVRVDGLPCANPRWILPRRPHTLVAARVVLVFFDPAHVVSRTASDTWRGFEPTAREQASAWLDGGALPPDFFATFGAESPQRLDHRVAAAVKMVEADPGVSLPAVASLLGLSASRLRHLVREQTGVPFSRLAIWEKMRRAVSSIAAGDGLASAAFAGGFADHAHLTRTFVAMFGQLPSELARRLERQA